LEGDLSRKFVSETVIEEKRKQIQEEWEKVRKPEDPEEAPEEEYDGRSLFERLQEQKDKKQEEWLPFYNPLTNCAIVCFFAFICNLFCT
uniref:Proteasome activator subunit 3 interacting protein 1 n=1 Tax=Salmo trutta TaxID=8032 RepID=A0A674AH14_SALTR